MERGGLVRIGELSRRVGVAPELLRAWETRYSLLEPSRSEGGFRLYSLEDERRVRAMRANLERGYSAAEAARLVVASGPELPVESPPPVDADGDAEHLREALDAFDEGVANVAFDRLLAGLSLETVLRLVLAYLHELGERWERGEASVAQEHFASNFLRGRLLGLARGWGQGAGERAILACAPGEHHDLPLVILGLALRGRGFRIAYLGPDTPVDTLAGAVEELEPGLVVVSLTSGDGLDPAALASLRKLGRRTHLALGGRAATRELADSAGASLLAGDPIAAADLLAGV